MTLTLLLDLDDTLLSNSMDTFVPKYLQALTAHMAAYAPPDSFASKLMAATGAMAVNDRPDQSLKGTFDAAFYASVGLDYAAAQSPLMQFYDEVFPILEEYTGFRPKAVDLVKAAQERGYRLVVATNPLFPQKAVHHRLQWAGLPVADNDFALVTTYEYFHYAKPNPAYFAEILAQIGWPEGPVVMVGNDANDDIAAARSLGLPTFWIANGAPLENCTAENPPAGCGELEDVLAWLDAHAAEELAPQFETPTALTALLKSTPAALDTLAASLTPEQYTAQPIPDHWSLTEVFCHLRDVEIEVNLPRLRKVIEADNALIEGQNIEHWAKARGYAQQDGPQALRDYIQARVQTLDVLDNLAEADWQRAARHTIFSRTSIQDLVGFTARHDRLHIRQAHKILKALG